MLKSLLVSLVLFATITPPAGCTIVGITGPDEGFPLAHCADGSYIYADLDGSLNREPGTWTDANGYLYLGRDVDG